MNDEKMINRVYKKYKERINKVSEFENKFGKDDFKKINLKANREFTFLLGSTFCLGGVIGIPFAAFMFYKSFKYHRKLKRFN